MNSHRTRSYLILLLVSIIWGAAGPIIKYTLQGIPALPFLAYRFTIAAIFSLAYVLIFGLKLPRPKQNLPMVLFYGATAFPLALGLLFLGLEKTTVLDMTLITLAGPLLVAVGGVTFFNDRITRREKIGISIIVIGAIFNTIFPAAMGHQTLRLSGNILLILFLLADNAAVLIAKKTVRQNIPPVTLINIGFIISALVLVPLAFLIDGVPQTVKTIIDLPLNYHLGVWYMALISGTLAYYLYVFAQKSIEVSEAALFSYLRPVFAVPLAIFWLKEAISPYFIFGAILIVIGITIAEYKKRE